MKPTNYHLFDFLDFDTELSRNESLWKAYKQTAVYEKEGDIYVTFEIFSVQYSSIISTLHTMGDFLLFL